MKSLFISSLQVIAVYFCFAFFQYSSAFAYYDGMKACSNNELLRIYDFFRNFTSLESNLEYNVYSYSNDGKGSNKGIKKINAVLKLSRPHKLKIDILNPNHLLILTNGGKVTIYDYQLREASHTQLSENFLLNILMSPSFDIINSDGYLGCEKRGNNSYIMWFDIDSLLKYGATAGFDGGVDEGLLVEGGKYAIELHSLGNQREKQRNGHSNNNSQNGGKMGNLELNLERFNVFDERGSLLSELVFKGNIWNRIIPEEVFHFQDPDFFEID